jgi:hypothetical protein
VYKLDDYSDFWTTDLKKYRLILTLYNGKDAYVIQLLSTEGLVLINEETDVNGEMYNQVIEKMLENGVEVLDIRSSSNPSLKKP